MIQIDGKGNMDDPYPQKKKMFNIICIMRNANCNYTQLTYFTGRSCW